MLRPLLTVLLVVTWFGITFFLAVTVGGVLAMGSIDGLPGRVVFIPGACCLGMIIVNIIVCCGLFHVTRDE